jgi:hypothetical protein
MEKIRTTLYLEQKLVELAHLETDNMSQMVNNLLNNYLSVSTTQDVDKEIAEHEKAIDILKVKKKSMLLAGMHESKQEGIQEDILKELQGIYVKRRCQANDHDADFEWLSSPKNLQRCKLLGKEPIVLVHELREWYKNKGDKA